MTSLQSISVIGAGAWGTALAAVAARAGRDVVLYARDPERGVGNCGDARQSKIAGRAARRQHRA